MPRLFQDSNEAVCNWGGWTSTITIRQLNEQYEFNKGSSLLEVSQYSYLAPYLILFLPHREAKGSSLFTFFPMHIWTSRKYNHY